MKEIVVLSGKGGTGKTTIAGGIFSCLSNAIAVDADVDAANLGIILPSRTIHEEKFPGAKKAEIGSDCTGCGICQDACHFKAIRKISEGSGRGRYVVDPAACEGCRVCELVCPQRAILLIPSIAGQIKVGETPFGLLFQAELSPGGENSGRLVSYLRRMARQAGLERGADVIITDGPPGIGCPVIASMTGSDAILLVTEPTITARADLQRAFELGRSFRRPMALAINKYDLHPDLSRRIEDWCEANSIPILGRFPYCPEARAAIAAGQPITGVSNSPLAKEVTLLAKRIMDFVFPHSPALEKSPRPIPSERDDTSFLTPFPSPAYPGSIEP